MVQAEVIHKEETKIMKQLKNTYSLEQQNRSSVSQA
jgi:hypothetical protein